MVVTALAITLSLVQMDGECVFELLWDGLSLPTGPGGLEVNAHALGAEGCGSIPGRVIPQT